MPDDWSPWLTHLTQWLSVPSTGLGAVFLVAFLSSTLLPLGSEATVLAFAKVRPDLFWPTIMVATVGNTLGGMLSWLMGRGAQKAWQHLAHRPRNQRALQWLTRFGPKACLLSWLPVVGDPLCAMAGWLNLPLWPCASYMAIGKFLRYVILTAGALQMLTWYWH